MASDAGVCLAPKWVCPCWQGGQMGEISRGPVVGIQWQKIPSSSRKKKSLEPWKPCHLVLKESQGWGPVLVVQAPSSQPDRSPPGSSPLLVSPLLFLNTGTFFFLSQRIKKKKKVGTSGPLPTEPPVPLEVEVRGSCWAIPRRHCFPLCLLVSKGNCTTKAPRVWNSAWGCFGYIEVFASVLPDLNGDFTSTELKRRRGRRASPGERASKWASRRERARARRKRRASALHHRLAWNQVGRIWLTQAS